MKHCRLPSTSERVWPANFSLEPYRNRGDLDFTSVNLKWVSTVAVAGV